MITFKQKQLLAQENFALATCDKNGQPNAIAVGCAETVGGDLILITDNFMNKTKKNILENNKVALAVWSKNGDEGYQFKGKADYLTSGEYKERVDNDPDNQGLAHKAAMLVHVEEIYDLANPKLLWQKPKK
ncbi:MAG: pyridoxamine 5'-phosphate oxidase family protein [Candidatus Shapirobacteria bacterium]